MKTPSHMRKKTLKAKEIRLLVREARSRLGVNIDPDKIEEAALKDVTLFWMDEAPLLIRVCELLVPTLTYQECLEKLPHIVVDMGAVPHVCSGADIMAPGVARVQGEFEKDELLVVRDERHGKALAIGLALLSSKEMRETKKGKVVRNLHYVGDKTWEAYK